VAALIPGIGWGCIAPWLQPPGTTDQHLRKYGYELRAIPVDALSGTTRNARQIRDAVMAMDAGTAAPRIVLVGYSKGTPDALEAIVNHPEIRPRVAAVVSVAGAVGGSALANEAEQYQADLMRHFPGATCDSGDGGGVASLRTDVRRDWLARNPLPRDVPTYSVVTLPQPERISSILRRSTNKLSMIDGRNDSQVIFYDQVIPGSTLVGYLNADHWAIAVPIARSHDTIASLFVTQNAYPREALMEAVLRFVEEDLAARGK
jgi:pimeloyl-ACP methyl ester carboxylesterase